MFSGNKKFIFVSRYTSKNFQSSFNDPGGIRSTRSFNAFFESVSKTEYTAEHNSDNKSIDSQPRFAGLQDFIQKMERGAYEYWVIEKGEIESYDEKKHSSSFLKIAQEDAAIENDQSTKKRELVGYYLLRREGNQLILVKKYLKPSLEKSANFREKSIEKNLETEKELGLLDCWEMDYIDNEEKKVNTDEIYITVNQQAWVCIALGTAGGGITIVFVICYTTSIATLGVGLIIGSILTAVVSLGVLAGGFYYRSIAAENQRIIQELYNKEQKYSDPQFYKKITSALPTFFKCFTESKESHVSVNNIVREIEESDMTIREKNTLYNTIQRQIR